MPPRPSTLRALALLLLAALPACRGGASADRPAPSPAEAGKATYTMACVRCHGPDGRGDGELGAKLAVPSLRTSRVAEMPSAELEAVVRDGRGAMPPHANRLPPAQIEQVAAFVRKLAEASP